MDNMEYRYVLLYLTVIHLTLTVSISAAPTTEVPYTHDTSNGVSENKSRVDVTQIPSTAAPHNLSSQATPGAGRVQKKATDGKFAHETTTQSIADVTVVSEGGSDPYVSEAPRVVNNLLTTILYPSTSGGSVETEGRAVTEQPSTEEDVEKWK
uniref:Putative secreted protein n=1 Tax=Phlebotomus kandelakii TaxID=1109342 RepID=A0A6B2EEK0_9DIPT